MTIYLPKPYDDELLYSVIARHCVHLNVKIYGFACKLFEKKFLKLRVDLPGSLKTVSEKTYLNWRKTAEEILNQMTLFPYYEAFLPTKIRSKKINALLYGIERSSIGIKAYRVESPKFLRYCIKCRELDIEEHGETYWHRTHQLPGVLVCPEHGSLLTTSCALIQPRRTECQDATLLTTNLPEGHQANFNPAETLIAQKIAMRCKEILFQKKSICSGENLGELYRNSALERGFEKLPGIFSPKVFERDFYNFYGSLLTRLGINTFSSTTSWVQFIFYNNQRQPVHPLEHILIQVFLEGLPVISSAQPFGSGPWKCPNQYAKHDDPCPIKKISIRSTKLAEANASVHCSCGFCFTFTGTKTGDPQMPIVKKVAAYGSSWKVEAERLFKSGFTLKNIASTMSIPVVSIRYLLNTNSKKVDIADEDITEARTQWLKLLGRDPKRSVTTIRRKNYGIYQFLRKHDRDWILSQTEPRKEKVNWKDRDAKWCILLEEAAGRIKSSAPIHRAAKTVIVKEAGLNLRMLNELRRLPLCMNSLIEKAETFKEFQIRVRKQNPRGAR